MDSGQADVDHIGDLLQWIILQNDCQASMSMLTMGLAILNIDCGSSKACARRAGAWVAIPTVWGEALGLRVLSLEQLPNGNRKFLAPEPHDPPFPSQR